jgi:hypothetical protein
MLTLSAVASADPMLITDTAPAAPAATEVGVAVLLGLGGDSFAPELTTPVSPHTKIHILVGIGDVSPTLPEAIGPVAGTMTSPFETAQLRGGLEERLCSRHICGVAGVDLGVLSSFPRSSETLFELSLIPRIGIEAGDRVRVRLFVEASTGLQYRDGRRDVGLHDAMFGPGVAIPF